jgi:hypothetical protein
MKVSRETSQQPPAETAARKRPDAPAKPWRANMRPPEAKTIEASAEIVPKPSSADDDKPWRTNMKRAEEKAPEVTVTTASSSRKRHFDRDEVKKYMVEKRRKEKARQEEEQRQGENM